MLPKSLTKASSAPSVPSRRCTATLQCSFSVASVTVCGAGVELAAGVGVGVRRASTAAEPASAKACGQGERGDATREKSGVHCDGSPSLLLSPALAALSCPSMALSWLSIALIC